jgi:hypothetical protein
MTDPLLRRLHDLPQAAPDAVRADGIRARCHTALSRRSRRGVWIDATELWAPIAAGVGGLYLTEVIHQALTVYGL